MKEKPKKLRKFVTKQGVTRTGNVVDIFDRALCNRIRERLKLSEEQLPDKDIKKVILLSNKQIGDFIIKNPDGYKMEIGFDSKKPMGFLVVSKHLPKEFREDQEQTVERIQSIPVSEQRRHQILKRYNIDVGHSIDYKKLTELGELIPHLNLSTYFYKYKIMWFNKRNCKTKKARAYTFKPIRPLNLLLSDAVLGGKDYYELNFSDFFLRKVTTEF